MIFDVAGDDIASLVRPRRAVLVHQLTWPIVMPAPNPQTTHFGFRDVPLADKQGMVDDVFHNVAGRYDPDERSSCRGACIGLWKRATWWRRSIRPGGIPGNRRNRRARAALFAP